MSDELQVFDYDDVEEIDGEIEIADVEVDENLNMSEEEAWGYKIIRRAAMLRGVTIHRDVFLRTELSKKCPAGMVDVAVATSPQKAGIPMDVIDELADAAINIETRKVSGLSALAGIPGGLAMIGTIPADLAQFFAHVLRVEQKLAYLYGWESFLNEKDEVDDETMTRLILFLGVMLQVGGASTSLTKFATTTARIGVAKTIQKQALTKTIWYNPLRKTLQVVGVRLTKASFAEAVAKGVPLIGGIISGGLTYATFKPGAVSLKKYLRTLPQATGVVLSDEEMEATLKQIEEESKQDFAAALASAGEKAAELAAVATERVGVAAGVVAEKAGAAASVAVDKAGSAAVVVREKGGAAAKVAAASVKKGFTGMTSRFAKGRKTKEPASSAEDIAAQLRAYKEMLDEGLITQEDYDAKKRELLGA